MTVNGIANGPIGREPRGPAHQEWKATRSIRRRSAPATRFFAGLRCCSCMTTPDRSQALEFSTGRFVSWGAFTGEFARSCSRQAEKARTAQAYASSRRTVTFAGDGGSNWPPSKKLLIPGAKWHQWDPAGPHSAPRRCIAGLRPAPPNTYYDFHACQCSWSRWMRISWAPARPACATARQFFGASPRA